MKLTSMAAISSDWFREALKIINFCSFLFTRIIWIFFLKICCYGSSCLNKICQIGLGCVSVVHMQYRAIIRQCRSYLIFQCPRNSSSELAEFAIGWSLMYFWKTFLGYCSILCECQIFLDIDVNVISTQLSTYQGFWYQRKCEQQNCNYQSLISKTN